MSNALAFFNKSLFMLRSVGFLGALGSYRGSIAIVSQLMCTGCAYKKVLSNARYGDSRGECWGLGYGSLFGAIRARNCGVDWADV